MGFSGSMVVCRTDASLDDVQAITERDDGLDRETQLGNRWRVGTYFGRFIVDDAEAMLRELAAETGAPALTGFVIDSDCVEIDALGPDSGYWRACLAREAMAGHLTTDGLRVDEEFPSPQDATTHALAWAGEAGLSADTDVLLDILRRGQADPLAEDLFFDFLHSLGLR